MFKIRKFVEGKVQARENSYKLESERRSRFIADIILSRMNKGKVLDLGCYDGGLSRYLLEFQYSGIDKLNIFKGVGKFYHKDLNTVIDPLAFLFIQDKFDCIVCTDVLEHLFYPDNVLNLIYDLLDDNGFAIISLPNEGGIKGFVQRHFLPPRTWDEQKDFYHLWYFTIEIAREFVIVKFDIVEEKPYFGRMISKFLPFAKLYKGWCSSWFMICKKA